MHDDGYEDRVSMHFQAAENLGLTYVILPCFNTNYQNAEALLMSFAFRDGPLFFWRGV